MKKGNGPGRPPRPGSYTQVKITLPEALLKAYHDLAAAERRSLSATMEIRLQAALPLPNGREAIPGVK